MPAPTRQPLHRSHPPPPLRVAVVERHNHALEHIHLALRRAPGLPSGAGWTLLHFDSHPDLACPDPRLIPARACFQPRAEWPAATACRRRRVGGVGGEAPPAATMNLYELLDVSPAGIAEWIVPLQLAGGCGAVEWRKPAWSRQFADGRYEYAVGVRRPHGEGEGATSFLDLSMEAEVAVTLRHAYYLEEAECAAVETERRGSRPTQSSVAENRGSLLLPRDTRLVVRTVGLPSPTNDDDDLRRRPWMLDVCLDHFVCSNPFLTEILRGDDPAPRAFVRALRALLSAAASETSRYARNSKRRRTSVEHLEDAAVSLRLWLTEFLHAPAENELRARLAVAFEDSVHGMGLVEELAAALDRCERPVEVAKAAVEVLPWIDLPQDDGEEGKGRDVLGARIKEFRTELLQYLAERQNCGSGRRQERPFLVTVARSVDDGYTAPEAVERLQREVLDIVHEAFCGCCHTQENCIKDDGAEAGKSVKALSLMGGAGCKCELLRDYGEWEGLTEG